MSGNDDSKPVESEDVEDPKLEDVEDPKLEGVDDSEPEGVDDSETEQDSKVDRAELNKVIKQRQDFKKRLREAERNLEEMRKANETEAERARREAAEAAVAETERRLKPLLIKSSVEKKLMENHVSSTQLPKVIRLLDLNDVDIDEDGSIMGVDEQLDSLMEEFPEVFQKKDPSPPNSKKKVVPPKVDGADKKAPEKKKSLDEILWEKIGGK